MPLTPEERIRLLSRSKSTAPTPGGLDLQSITLGRTPTVRFGQTKEKELSSTNQRDLSRITSFEQTLNEMEKLATSVPKGPIKGRAATFGASLSGGGKIGSMDQPTSTNVINYNQLRPGIAAGLYRAVTGDDRISDIDAAKRAMPFVPDMSLQPEAFAQRLQFMRQLITRRKQAILEASQQGVETGAGDLSGVPEVDPNLAVLQQQFPGAVIRRKK